MDPHAFREKLLLLLKKHKKGLTALAVCVFLVGIGSTVIFMTSGSRHESSQTVENQIFPSEQIATPTREPAAVHQSKPGYIAKVLEAYEGAFQSAQSTLDEIRRASEENKVLRLENAQLRSWSEKLRFDCGVLESERKTDKISMQLSETTEAKVGRVLASIEYRPPPNMLPEQMLTLGVSYFSGGEYEKAAVIFTFLTGFEDDDTFKTPRNYLLTGASWYRLDNYKLADKYFEKVLEYGPSPEILKYQAHVRLWKALVAKRRENHREVQKWLVELVDHHPLSMETTWVNPAGGTHERVPAQH